MGGGVAWALSTSVSSGWDLRSRHVPEANCFLIVLDKIASCGPRPCRLKTELYAVALVPEWSSEWCGEKKIK